jgi:hypothetical protein
MVPEERSQVDELVAWQQLQVFALERLTEFWGLDGWV